MKNISMKKGFGINLRPTTRIIGRWHQNEYLVIRKLGSGMIGSVYLCKRNGRYVALKISRQSLSMTKEVNVLRSLKQVQDQFLGPYLLDVDDWISSNNESYSFYVMEYINGISFKKFIRQKGPEWITTSLIQLLSQLEYLHQTGWVFGDLKEENLIIEQMTKRVRFIDVGGTTKMNRAIKEYSEFYDRGYWQLGSRKAEPSYDLFALVMVFLACFYPQQFKKRSSSLQLLDRKIMQIAHLRPLRRQFKKAIRGEYKTAREMKDEIIQTSIKGNKHHETKQEKGWLELLLLVISINVFFISKILFF